MGFSPPSAVTSGAGGGRLFGGVSRLRKHNYFVEDENGVNGVTKAQATTYFIYIDHSLYS